jgi:hypothetical protein
MKRPSKQPDWLPAIVAFGRGDPRPLRELAEIGAVPDDAMCKFLGMVVLWKLRGPTRGRPPGTWTEWLKNVDFCRAVAVSYYLKLERIKADDMRCRPRNRPSATAEDRAADGVALQFHPPLTRGAVHRAVTRARDSLSLTKGAALPPLPTTRKK